MKLKYIGILFVFFFLSGLAGLGQSISSIRKDKEKIEKEITYLNKLLEEAKSDRNVSVERLNILQQKIVQSKSLIQSLKQEVKYLENQIGRNESRIFQLITDRESMLSMYGRLVYGLWKKRDKTDKLMFIFASSDFNQAYNRYKYFEQIQSYSKRQLALIGQMNDSLNVRNEELKKYIALKNAALDDIDIKNRDLITQQESENKLIAELQKKEKQIVKKLQAEAKNRERLERELNKLIASQAKKSGGTSSSYKLTPEEKLLSDDFSKNKGKLPWPVTQGIISEKFGVNPHPVYKRVLMSNDGINITTSKNAEVRAVFNGVVSDIALMPGINNAVIIRHGNYLTVYTNLVYVSVKKGEKVTTKQTIGKVAYDTEKGSIMGFQVWNNLNKQNPELWLAK
ncbi:MAG: peptidoglycan DD-metalloendopeptidase family protein [Odoribacter sp.]|nr:peptidoglycan DD-metalloendopeptidase family protein [Odoribacter sp.]